MLNVEAGNPAHRQPAKTTGMAAVAPPFPPMPSAPEDFREVPICGRAALLCRGNSSAAGQFAQRTLSVRPQTGVQVQRPEPSRVQRIGPQPADHRPARSPQPVFAAVRHIDATPETFGISAFTLAAPGPAVVTKLVPGEVQPRQRGRRI